MHTYIYTKIQTYSKNYYAAEIYAVLCCWCCCCCSISIISFASSLSPPTSSRFVNEQRCLVCVCVYECEQNSKTKTSFRYLTHTLFCLSLSLPRSVLALSVHLLCSLLSLTAALCLLLSVVVLEWEVWMQQEKQKCEGSAINHNNNNNCTETITKSVCASSWW